MVCPVRDRTESDIAQCSLRMLPEEKRRRFVNLYLRGRAGLHAEATELLFNLANRLNLKENPEHMITYIDTILKIDRNFKPTGNAAKKESERDETPIKAPKIEVSIAKKAAKKSPEELIVRGVEKELDWNPESLFNSPVVDETKALLKIGEFKLPNEKKEILIDLT